MDRERHGRGYAVQDAPGLSARCVHTELDRDADRDTVLARILAQLSRDDEELLRQLLEAVIFLLLIPLLLPFALSALARHVLPSLASVSGPCERSHGGGPLPRLRRPVRRRLATAVCWPPRLGVTGASSTARE
ncbi:hypothetical protein SVIOM342S_03652 [Streptomyces violaceorubidus]